VAEWQQGEASCIMRPVGGNGTHRRIGTVARAAIWYPIACVVVAVLVGIWFYVECGDATEVAECREAIVPGTLLFLAVILVAGIGVLAIVWVLSRVAGYVLARTSERSDGGFASPQSPPAPASKPRETTGPATGPADVSATRAKRHEPR